MSGIACLPSLKMDLVSDPFGYHIQLPSGYTGYRDFLGQKIKMTAKKRSLQYNTITIL